jgi:hypothetical protein
MIQKAWTGDQSDPNKGGLPGCDIGRNPELEYSQALQAQYLESIRRDPLRRTTG